MNATIKNSAIQLIAYLYAFLFIYAAFSKLLDYDNFIVQLGQSPIVSSFALVLSILVPFAELLLSLGLFIKRFRLFALYSSMTLMVLFTAYIFIILNYSTYVPCACGGVLEKMNWQQHFVFNLLFVFMGAVAITINSLKWHTFAVVFGCMVSGSLSMYLLYTISETAMKYQNSFVRRFPPHLVDPLNTAELKFNSYYFAGATDGILYLGNTTAPLLVTLLDSTLQFIGTKTIAVSPENPKMFRPQIKIAGSHFYLYEGSAPYLYRGNTNDWKASLKLNDGYFFSQLQPLDSSKVVLRYNDPETAANIIGMVDLSDFQNNVLRPDLLEKQLDGTFDTDGMILTDLQNKSAQYVYYYRNAYVSTTEYLQIKSIGKTIDTISHPDLKVVSLKNSGTKTFAKMPLLVNRIASSDAGWLFVNSQLMGYYEPEAMWQTSSIIDIYNIETNAYLSSFYLDRFDGQQPKSFMVIGTNVYVLGGTQITRYLFRKTLAQGSE
ncbi:MauE/DoxX family redox-associated membrane protein [Flavobacterium qiangtangense]|uniref:MauE/DoxX family redox-associated membrane protein n=1 Tax=Flavobacterium qiangtangense TaxID=1442595 RepID=A0ABW1PL69_9FLAO